MKVELADLRSRSSEQSLCRQLVVKRYQNETGTEQHLERVTKARKTVHWGIQ